MEEAKVHEFRNGDSFYRLVFVTTACGEQEQNLIFLEARDEDALKDVCWSPLVSTGVKFCQNRGDYDRPWMVRDVLLFELARLVEAKLAKPPLASNEAHLSLATSPAERKKVHEFENSHNKLRIVRVMRPTEGVDKQAPELILEICVKDALGGNRWKPLTRIFEGPNSWTHPNQLDDSACRDLLLAELARFVEQET